MTTRLAAIARRRHDIIHGNIEGICKSDPPKLLVRTNGRNKDGGIRSQIIQLTLDEINQLVNDIQAGLYEMANASFVLMTHQKDFEMSGIEKLLALTEADQKPPKPE